VYETLVNFGLPTNSEGKDDYTFIFTQLTKAASTVAQDGNENGQEAAYIKGEENGADNTVKIDLLNTANNVMELKDDNA